MRIAQSLKLEFLSESNSLLWTRRNWKSHRVDWLMRFSAFLQTCTCLKLRAFVYIWAPCDMDCTQMHSYCDAFSYWCRCWLESKIFKVLFCVSTNFYKVLYHLATGCSQKLGHCRSTCDVSPPLSGFEEISVLLLVRFSRLGFCETLRSYGSGDHSWWRHVRGAGEMTAVLLFLEFSDRVVSSDNFLIEFWTLLQLGRSHSCDHLDEIEEVLQTKKIFFTFCSRPFSDVRSALLVWLFLWKLRPSLFCRSSFRLSSSAFGTIRSQRGEACSHVFWIKGEFLRTLVGADVIQFSFYSFLACCVCI